MADDYDRALLERLEQRGWLSPEQRARAWSLRSGGDPLPAVLARGFGVPPEQITEALRDLHRASGEQPALSGPRRVGEYLIERELGRGANGVVYLARREGLPRPFALKVLLDDRYTDPETVARFRQEALLASRLDDPGIVGVFDLGTHNQHHYYVMDFCPGETLEDHLRQHALSPRDAARLVAQLAQTAHAAHEVHIVHRDLKPANVILDPQGGRPRITDFGLARDLASSGLTRTGDVVGTPYYMAPEQFDASRTVDARVDVYALGVILYECLCRRRPFKAKDLPGLARAIRAGRPTPPREVDPSVPPDLERICLRAMDRTPGARYPSARRLQDDLERFVRGDALYDSDSSIRPGASEPSRVKVRWPPLVAAVLLLGTAGGVGAALALRGWPTSTPPPLPPTPPPRPPPPSTTSQAPWPRSTGSSPKAHASSRSATPSPPPTRRPTTPPDAPTSKLARRSSSCGGSKCATRSR